MAIAKGQSCVMAELDILKDTLESMINSTESKFRDIIDSLKDELFDIEHDKKIGPGERNSLLCTYYSELDKYITQRFLSRNKLVICIYSICESTLASICKDYNFKIEKEVGHNSKLISCPNMNGRECNIKRKKNTIYYLNDYLYTLNPRYSVDWKDAYIVSTDIKDLRNYLTHSKTDVTRAAKIIQGLSNNRFEHISQVEGNILIQKVEDIHKILKLCYEMLISAEKIAKSKSIEFKP